MWFAVVALRVQKNGPRPQGLVCVKFSSNQTRPNILMLLLNPALVPPALLLNLVLVLWFVVPCGSKCACGAGSKRRA